MALTSEHCVSVLAASSNIFWIQKLACELEAARRRSAPVRACVILEPRSFALIFIITHFKV
jgi:hypothetical protein